MYQSVRGNMHAIFILLFVSIVKAGRFRAHLQNYGLDAQAFDMGQSNKEDFDNFEDFSELKFKPNQLRKSKDVPNESLTFVNLRDEMQYYKNKAKYQKNYNKFEETSYNETVTKVKTPTSYDFSNLLERNLVNPSRRNGVFQSLTESKGVNMTEKGDKVTPNYFEHKTFYKKLKLKKSNWTTCDEFVRKSLFHPDDIINTKWLPFFIWSDGIYGSAVIHTFSYPTKKRVQQFKTTYGRYYMDKVNWKAPKLLMAEMREILLIAADRRGLFHGIPEHELPLGVRGKNITLPLITIRMKIHDPYLVLMYCDEHYAAIMAELHTVPESDEDKIHEASTLKFRGKGGPVSRDIEEEKRIAEIVRQKQIYAESRKFLNIEKVL